MIKKYTAIIAAMLFVVLSVSAKEKKSTGNIDIKPLALEQRGDSLYVELLLSITGDNVNSRSSRSFFPYLSTADNDYFLPEVVVKGRNNYKSYKRKLALMNRKKRAEYNKTAPYLVIKEGCKKQHTVVEYNKAIEYEAWMDYAQLNLKESAEWCGDAPRILAVSTIINTVKRQVPYTPVYAYITPMVEAVKRREVSSEAFLDFAVSKIDIRPEYMNNPRELKKITDMIEDVRRDSNITVNSISVIGFASPEGTLKFNKYLSEERAKALVGYLVPRLDYPESHYKVVFGGENWVGLRECIVASDMNDKAALLDIIDNVPVEINYKTNTSRKKTLMIFKQGGPYRYMLKEFYPSLRKALCTIAYEVKGVTVLEAKEIIKTKPQNLSLIEMFLVANTYEKGSKEFVEVFETAVRMFPSDQTANINAAVTALERKDIASAEGYLSKVNETSSSEYNNAMGALMMLKEEYKAAEAFLQKAADMGLDAAKQNLKEIKKKLVHIKVLNNRKTTKKQ